MDLDRTTLELQAGLLAPANFPRLAAEAIAARRYGETLVALANLIGEPQERILAVIRATPDVEARILAELGAPSMTAGEAVWKLARSLAGTTASGGLDPREGAGELTSLARAADDPVLLHEAGRLEGILDQWEHIPPDEREGLVVEECKRLSTIQPA